MLSHRVGVNSSQDARKRRRVRALQRYVLNPPMKLLVWFGLVPGHVLIETRGRRTGKRRTNVVGMHVEERTGWIVAEQGGHAGYVRNLQADPAVRVRVSRRWCRARAEVIPDDDPDARLDSFDRRSHAAAVRRFGTSLSTIRLDLSPAEDAPQNTHPQTTPGDAS
jgi:deazaflavin-dependent oxidoreductase (nitroreductase family)